jgi:hypothetical protein
MATSNLVVILCAPEHDDLTKFTATLFANFPGLGAPTHFFRITQPTTYEQLLSQLTLPQDAEVALVFSGHGESDALMGPGDPPSCFYDDTSLHLGPKLLLAFCCNAAAGLGTAFGATTGRTFVGFRRPIGFVMGGVYTDWWRKILHGASLAMLHAGGTRQLENDVRALYRSAYHYFNSPEGRKNKWALVMRMYLRGHLDELDVNGA